jgi:phenylacetate-coenzyme A ligase PaaK-like adenylate-forming protein
MSRFRSGQRRASAPGERGELAPTTLKRTARPMIRFRTGDIISFNFKPCRCGLIFHVSEETFGIRPYPASKFSNPSLAQQS